MAGGWMVWRAGECIGGRVDVLAGGGEDGFAGGWIDWRAGG